MIDLNQMTVFAAVAKAQSFTHAARVLGMPKSTVSQRVSELEARLGAKLLHRTTRKVRLTEAGQAYHERCTRLVAEAEEADRVVAHADTSARGTLRVTTSLLFGHTFLAPIVAQFAHQNPHVRVEVLTTDRRVDLIEENIDVAIRAGRLDGSLVARKLGVGASYVCASPAYLKAHGEPKRPADLEDHPCVAVAAGSGNARWTLARGAKSVEVSVPVRVRSSSILFASDAIVAGCGIGLVPSFLCNQEIAKGRLVRILPEWGQPAVPIQIVYPPNRWLTGRVRNFVDLVIETFTPTPPWAAE
jgi:DNA-binding transcriptional LysR family regulator